MVFLHSFTQQASAKYYTSFQDTKRRPEALPSRYTSGTQSQGHKRANSNKTGEEQRDRCLSEHVRFGEAKEVAGDGLSEKDARGLRILQAVKAKAIPSKGNDLKRGTRDKSFCALEEGALPTTGNDCTPWTPG